MKIFTGSHNVLAKKIPWYCALTGHERKRRISFSGLVLTLGLVMTSLFWQAGMAQSTSLNYEGVFLETNSIREHAGLSVLMVDPNLTRVAQEKAEDIIRRGYFSHIDPGGNMIWKQVELSGYNYTFSGENLAKGYDDMKELLGAWMDSPKHKANILSANYEDIGVGVAMGYYAPDQKNETIIVQLFGSKK